MQFEQDVYNPDCKKCQRLAGFLAEVKAKHSDFICKPVPPFGDPKARLLVVGLAPGLKGANATGRPFTGDHAGILLYQTLYDFGFASKPDSESATDGLQLFNCRITNAVKCLPPENKPTASEVNQCNDYLATELSQLPPTSVVLSLGLLSHKAVLKALNLRQADFKFAHQAVHQLNSSLSLVDSYHCSRYNTNTGRLTEVMFQQVFEQIVKLLNRHD